MQHSWRARLTPVSTGSTTMRVTPTPALIRLERKLARDRRAILSAADVQLLDDGIEDWAARWCRANQDLAARAGLLADNGR